MTTDTYLSDRDLARRYGIHRTTPWRWTERGEFPQPVKLSPGCTRWRRSEIESWERERAGETT